MKFSTSTLTANTRRAAASKRQAWGMICSMPLCGRVAVRLHRADGASRGGRRSF